MSETRKVHAGKTIAMILPRVTVPNLKQGTRDFANLNKESNALDMATRGLDRPLLRLVNK